MLPSLSMLLLLLGCGVVGADKASSPVILARGRTRGAADAHFPDRSNDHGRPRASAVVPGRWNRIVALPAGMDELDGFTVAARRRSAPVTSPIRSDFWRSEEEEAAVIHSSDHALLVRGGGGGNGGGASFVVPETPKAPTFARSLAGSVFSLLSVMYGISCGLAPSRTARLLYGYDESDRANSPDVGRFLMRLVGAVASGIGLTAAFAIAVELKVPKAVLKPATYCFAIGVGLAPRALLIVPALATGMPEALRINRTDAAVALVHSAAFAVSMFTGKLVPPDSILYLEVAFHLLLGPLLFFRPAILFQPSAPPSRHEKFMTRLVASYSMIGAVLLAGLQHSDIDAMLAVGMAALAYVVSLVHLIFVRKDVKECGSSVAAHFVMMTIGVAVAAAGLSHHLIFLT